MNKQKNNKNGNVHIGLVLAVLGLLVLAGTADAKTYNTTFWGKGFTPNSLMINTGDEVSWYADSSIKTTITSIDGLFEPRIFDRIPVMTSYIFDVPGRYSIKGTAIWRNDEGAGIQIISVNDVPQMKIVSYGFSYEGVSTKLLNIEVPIGRYSGFNITMNYDIDSVLNFNIPYSTVVKTNSKNVYMDVQFPTAGTFYIQLGAVNNAYGSSSMTWIVNVINPITTPTVVPTPVPTIIPTVSPTVSPTAIVTVVPTPVVTDVTNDTSPGHPDEYWERMREKYPPNETNKRAILEVTNKIDRSGNGAIITVSVRNIGDDTARFVNFSSSIPSELGAELVSGADWSRNNASELSLTWKGDIGIGEKHDIIYKVKPVKIDINIPVKVTYVKDSLTAQKAMSKAAASGIETSSVPVDPQDLQVIYYVILITKAILPGFEVIFGMIGIGTIYILRRKR